MMPGGISTTSPDTADGARRDAIYSGPTLSQTHIDHKLFLTQQLVRRTVAFFQQFPTAARKLSKRRIASSTELQPSLGSLAPYMLLA
jgi:hypothetical protein